jgi:hypothetical protein
MDLGKLRVQRPRPPQALTRGRRSIHNIYEYGSIQIKIPTDCKVIF